MLNDFTKRVAATVGKHFVTLSCEQHVPGVHKPKTLVFSGFVVEILGEWFYVTAGHIVEDVRSAIVAGAHFDTWRLGDQTAGNSFNGAAVPYDFDVDKWLVLDDREAGLDYALVHLHGICRSQLEAGGVLAISSEAWSDHVTQSDQWALVGVPSESVVNESASVITARVVLVPLVAAEEPPAAGRRARNQFYAKPAGASDPFFKSPDGFSGAPVFSLVYAEGQWLYNVIGIQSSWYPESSTLAACPFSTFAQEIESVVAEALVMHSKPAETSSAV